MITCDNDMQCRGSLAGTFGERYRSWFALAYLVILGVTALIQLAATYVI